MSVARPARSLLGTCLFSTRTTATTTTTTTAASRAISCHKFHTTAPAFKRQPPSPRTGKRFRNIAAQELGLLKPEQLQTFADEKLPEYSPEDEEALRTKYSPQQVEAVKAGELAIDPLDLLEQGRLRDEYFRPDYMDDYSVLDPRYDLKPEVEGTPREHEWLDRDEWIDNYGAKMRTLTDKKTSDQLVRAMVRAMRRVKESNGEDLIDLTEDELKDIENDPELIQRYTMTDDKAEPKPDSEAEAEAASDEVGPGYLTRAQAEKLDEALNAEWEKELDKIAEFSTQAEVEPSSVELIQDGPAGVDRLHTAEAPELGKVPGVAGLYKNTADPEDQGQDDAGKFQEIKRLTGMTLRDIQSLVTKSLVTRWVSNQTRLGKVRSTSVVAIAGNGNGRLGLGMAKSTEPGVAEETAQMLAIRNMKPIRRYENRTVYGNISAKISGTVVELFARPQACFGLRVPYRVFEMCRAAGIHDLSARMPRSKNPMNSVKAVFKALTNQPDPERIAIGRGKKMVDVRKVYYGGSVY